MKSYLLLVFILIIPKLVWSTSIEIGAWIIPNAAPDIKKEQYIMVDFWATWCGPCLKAMDHMSELKKTTGEKVIYLSITNENQTLIQQFFKNREAKTFIVTDYKNRTFDNIVPVPPFFLSVWWKNTYQLLSPMLWAILGILFLLGAVGGIGVWLIFQNRKHKQRGFYGAIAASVLGILFLLLGNSYHNAQVNSKMAIITAKQVDFKNGADELSNTVFVIPSAVTVSILFTNFPATKPKPLFIG